MMPTFKMHTKHRGKLCAAAVVSVLMSGTVAQAEETLPMLSTYGTPGLLDMPIAGALPDGALVPTLSFQDGTLRNTLAFQVTPRITGTFRYSIIDNYDVGEITTRYDRSFDFIYHVMDEGEIRPSVSIGLRDFGGTGLYGSEYVVATKSIGSRLQVTGGLGWGRLGSYQGFKNPLSFLGDGFEERPFDDRGINQTGRLDFGQWFRGDAALFGGFSYQVNDRLSVRAEYSSDAYVLETERVGFEQLSHFNFGATYRMKNGIDVTAFSMYGAEYGLMASIPVYPGKPNFAGGIESAPPALKPRYALAAKTWSEGSEDNLTQALKAQGIDLQNVTVAGQSAKVRIVNNRYSAVAQAIGRTARILANTMPTSVNAFEITTMDAGIPIAKTTVQRADLTAYEHDLEGSWKMYSRAKFTDPADDVVTYPETLYPKLSYSLTGYIQPELFDPDAPFRADAGVQFEGSYSPTPGLIFSTAVRQPLFGNLDQSTRDSNSILPHVRSDAPEYNRQSDLEVKYLTAEYFFRPGKNLYGRVTAGYLETMYGGVSTELLWKPVNSRLALGAELNYVVQRDFDQLFGFQDYKVATGHASAYYDFQNGYLAQIDVGRYLAGDWGGTVGLDREFDNGVKVGAYFTLTDVSFDDFGEGSFDKGIRLTLPVEWLTGIATKEKLSTVIQPVYRDGGARLNVRNRLFDVTRDHHTTELEDRWGRFWR